MHKVYADIAKALINDSRDIKTSAQFDFSNKERLAKQLSEVFVIRWGKDPQATLKNVAEYVKRV
jgi:hypothetical protein